MEDKRLHEAVKAGYARVASGAAGPSAAGSGPCCHGQDAGSRAETAARIGYSNEDISGAAAEANLGLGCGNPVALASLRSGDVVVDLGSGAGFDALLSADRLGPQGRFIGIDMTPEMLERARINAVQAGHARTIEFREGLIEELPVASASADVVISNCVINLSPDKPRVFREAFRVLKPGGRLVVSDIVLSEPLPADVAGLASTWVACIGGALTEAEYLGYIRAAGFEGVEYTRRPAGPLLAASLQDPMWQAIVEAVGEERIEALAGTVFSYSITAAKP